MKRSSQALGVFLILFLVFLAACVPSVPEKTATNETGVAAASTLLAQTMTAVPTLTGTPARIVPSPTSTITPGPSLTPWPDFETNQIPALLQSALTVEALPGLNGHALQRVSGWKYGFDRVEWLDAGHVLLYPYAGMTGGVGDSMRAGTYPAVMNRDSGRFFIPSLQSRDVDRRASLPGSQQLKVLIVPNQETVDIYSLDGTRLNSYPGSLLGVSPSGTKILVSDSTWIDLRSGRNVDFAWPQEELASNAQFDYDQFPPLWSPDENRVYLCCYLYGDARSGRSLSLPYDKIPVVGEEGQYDFLAFSGVWVLDRDYVLPIWGGVWDGRPNWVALFDPAAGRYRNLSAAVGLPYTYEDETPYCNRPSAQNGGRYVWVNCRDGGHLIDLVTSRSQSYPPVIEPNGERVDLFTSDEKWSADGAFVLLGSRLLSGTTGEMKPLPEDCLDSAWHPQENILLCTSEDGRKLSLLDAGTAAIQKEINLPAAFMQAVWSPDGKQIALAASDGSLWQIASPSLEHLEQLTAPLTELTTTRSLLKNIVWSADGTALAFTGSQDVYIVSIGVIP